MSEDYSKDGHYILPTGEYLWVNNNNKYYYKDNAYSVLHRENDLPAYEGFNGTKEWFADGKYHRENGSAIEYANGDKFWYLNGEILPVNTQEEFEKYKKFKHFF